MPEGAADLHQPVLRTEVVSILSPLTGKTVVDGTLGLGGHTEALLQADETVRVIGIDRDAEAIALASQRLDRFGSRLRSVHGNFRDLDQHLDGLGIKVVDGVLLDIGVSSLQLDANERGFSFRRDGPLDMRMNREAPVTAADWIYTATESALADVIYKFGEERYGRRIARAIVKDRESGRIESTAHLADVVRKAVPAKYDHRRLDPATRTFQAIRMYLNDELGSLEAGLAVGFERLAIGGIFVAISFHSLEDRIVKRFFRERARNCVCPPKMPECVCGKEIEAEILTQRPLTATPEEVAVNRRSRSAKLRAAIRLR
ncbi:16S rRNA (cytosine(1402)-N(4))-methyltransferase RsmH [Candidatus Bipolaricaulota bacterium]|nr:16S rRNA (cytosine(1402)-N(4))-methyltransferase RsmH [Candidatus Bipolaricaulota bacterium]